MNSSFQRLNEYRFIEELEQNQRELQKEAEEPKASQFRDLE